MSDLYTDPLWVFIAEEIDEQLGEPFSRQDGGNAHAYYQNYTHYYDGVTLRITNAQTGRVFQVTELPPEEQE